MSSNLVIMDTCNLFLKAKSDGATIMSSSLQLGAIEQSISEERLKGGLGNSTLAILSTDKELSVNTRDALWNLDYLALTQGVKIDPVGKTTVRKSETVKTTGVAPSLKATIVGTPVGTVVTYVDASGETKTGAVAVKEVTLTGTTLKSGDLVTIYYDSEVTGEMVTFDAKTFSQVYSLELQTIAYDPSTMVVKKDIYIQFDSCKAEGAFSMSFEAGSAISPEVSFMVLTPPNSSVMGRIVSVDRV